MAADVRSSSERFEQDLDELVRARYALVAVETNEEQRALALLKAVATNIAHRSKGLYIWSRTRGIVQVTGPGVSASSGSGATGKPKVFEGTEDPLSCLDFIAKADAGLFALCDFASSVEDPVSGALLIRLLRELAWSVNGKEARDPVPQARPVTVFLVGPRWPDLPALEKEITRRALPLPDRAELRAMVWQKVGELTENPARGIKVDIDEATADRLAIALLGLTEQEADNVLSKATVRGRGLSAAASKAILEEKAKIVRATEGLEYEEPEETDALGGYQRAQDYLGDAAITLTPEAEAFGVTPSKGALLVGPPGTGKTYTARVAAGRLQRPLLKLSMSAVMSAGGGVLGQAEGTLKRVMLMADTIKPILLVDEADRMLAGEESSGHSDSGTTARMIGELMSWQATQQGTLVLMTSNHAERMDPARFRAGRLSEVLFYDLPTYDEREEILTIHIRRKRRNPASVNCSAVAAETDLFSGAELEQLVQGAVLRAFKDGQRPITTDDLLAAAADMNPLARLAPEGVQAMREWAVRHNAKRANSNSPEPSPELVDAARPARRRTPEL